MAQSTVDTAAFERDLENYINNLLPQGLEKGLEIACVAVEAQAKKNCPVDDGVLRASITHEVEGTIGYVGTNVEYAPYVHQGTGIYASEGGGRTTPWFYQGKDGKVYKTVGQKPQPFLKDSVESLSKQIPRLIEKGLK